MTNWDAIPAAISSATNCSFTLRSKIPVRGGSINQSFRLEGTDGSRYFLKINDAQHLPMFVAEAAGLAAIAATNAIRVPKPITHGTAGKQSYLVLEHLELSGRGDTRLLGEQLAALHRCTPLSLSSARVKDITNDLSGAVSQPSRMASSFIRMRGEKESTETLPCFGFAQDTFIGTTPQPNVWKTDWIAFWHEHRLGFQLGLAEKNGYGGKLQTLGEKILGALPAFFEGYTPQPSLLHGDLWSGNHGFLADGTPAIFDPATYYGDRECDLAMTELFGGYSTDFYSAYRAAYPLDTGYANRRALYNLYHILNHANLFGGGYERQAEGMMHKLLMEIHS